jgi:hypothetical protein
MFQLQLYDGLFPNYDGTTDEECHFYQQYWAVSQRTLEIVVILKLTTALRTFKQL